MKASSVHSSEAIIGEISNRKLRALEIIYPTRGRHAKRARSP